MKTSFVKLLTVVMLAFIVSACGKGPKVTAIQVQSQTVDSDVLLSVIAELEIGKLLFPSVSLPILHPRGQTPIGSVDLAPVLGGKNQIKISVNVSALSDIEAAEAFLPNGNMVPLIANNPTITVNLGSGAKLYLTVGANAVAIGVAIPIKTFDGIGRSVGAINLFPTFVIDQVLGSVGLFTGPQAGQNGFALVADVTSYVNMQDIFVPQMAARMIQEEQARIRLDYTSQAPSRSKKNKIDSMIYKLNRKGKRLELAQ